MKERTIDLKGVLEITEINRTEDTVTLALITPGHSYYIHLRRDNTDGDTPCEISSTINFLLADTRSSTIG